MLLNYIIVTLRAIRRQPGYSAINVVGLAVGIACCILALLFVRDELSFDRFHEDVDSIYRVTVENRANGMTVTVGLPATAAEDVRGSLPGVESLAFVRNVGRVSVGNGERLMYQDDFVQADSGFFDVFSFPLDRGDRRTALVRPGSIVLSPSVARRFFGADDPMGRTLLIDGDNEYEVTGILQDDPAATHLRFSMLGSLSTYTSSEDYNRDSFVASWQTYAELAAGYSGERLQSDVESILTPYLETLADEYDWSLIVESVPDIYLRPKTFKVANENLRGDLRYIYIFSAIAGLILLIACVNYVNLATARASRRSREIGIRKVAGAGRIQLMRQFLGESLVFTVLALLLAVGLTELFLPGFNQITGKELDLGNETDPILIFLLAGLTLVVAFIAGIYPALILSSLRPIEAISGRTSGVGLLRTILRKGLVVFQFGISAFLIVSTLIIRDQLHFIQNRDLGIDTEQVILLRARDGTLNQYPAFKDALLGAPGVEAVTTAPLPGGSGFPFRKPNEEENLYMSAFPVDFDFADVMGLEVVQGRLFDPSVASDSDRSMVVNEAAARKMEWENPIGQELEMLDLDAGGFKRMTVVGVVRNFNTSSLRNEISSQFLFITSKPRIGSILIKLDRERVTETLREIEQQWKSFEPAYPFEYVFLDEKFGEYYRSEQRLGQIFSVFAFLAIFIAALGLLGLVAYMTEQRTKEIGIRKALGATASSVVILLSKEFLRLVVVAAIVFTPIAYVGLKGWLNEFAYRIEVGPIHFIVTGLLLFLIALLAVGGQTLRAATRNPVESLRHE